MVNYRLTRKDIMSMSDYKRIRNERRQEIRAIKRDRRLSCGPDATFYFENYETMHHQVHEMLYIEKGGDSQIEDELLAYNPLIPNGHELVATLMFEIADPIVRAATLSELGGVEKTISLQFSTESIPGIPENDIDRTSSKGKASAVQFVHFLFSQEQIKKFKEPNVQPKIAITHLRYNHSALMPSSVHKSLIGDLD